MRIPLRQRTLSFIIISAWFSLAAIAGEIKGETQAQFLLGKQVNLFFDDSNTNKVVLDSAYSNVGSEHLSYSSLPAPLSDFSALVVRDRLYVVGGYTTSGIKRQECFSRALSPTGPTGSWRTETALPEALARCGLFSTTNRLYVTSSDGSRVIYSAPINVPEGSIGAWEFAGQLPLTITDHTVSLLGMRIIVIPSNRTGVVYSAPVLANGSIGSWRNEAPLPVKISGFAVAETATTLYVTGGTDESSTVLSNVYSISQNIDGTMSGWRSQPPLPLALAFHEVKADRGLLVVVGGAMGAGLSKRIMSANIKGNGDLTEWINEVNSVPTPVSGHRIVFGDEYFLSCGGNVGGTPSGQIVVFPLGIKSRLVEPATIGNPLPSLKLLNNTDGVFVGNRFYALGGASIDDYIYSIGFESNGVMEPTWREDKPHPRAYRTSANAGKLLYASGKMYYIEGFATPPNIYMAPMTSDGMFADWQVAGLCPKKFKHYSVIVLGTRIYFIGGIDIGTPSTEVPLANVYSAPIHSDGSIGSWTPEPSLPLPSYMCAVFVNGDRIYISGGRHSSKWESNSDVYSATILPGGSLSNWNLIGNLPQNIENHAMFLSDDKVIVVGGQRSYTNSYGMTVVVSNGNIYETSMSMGGSIGVWSTYSNNPAFQMVSLHTFHGFTYMLGKNDVYLMSHPTYTTDGTFFSPVYDLNGVQNLSTVSWNKITNPSGTSIKCSVAIQSDPNGPMDFFTPVRNFLPITKLGRYAQLRFDFHTDDVLQTSGLDDYTITHYSDSTHPDSAPVLNIVNVTTSSLSVSLQDRSVGEEAFQFFLSRTSPPTGDPIKYESVIGSSGTTKSYTFDRLLHGTTYYLRARGWNAADSIDGADSNLISIQTPSLDLKRRLSTELLGLDSVVIGWPQVDNAIEYRVYDGGNNLLITKSSSTLSFTETVLAPNTQLFRRIEASDSIGVIQVGSVVLYTGLAAPLATDFSIESQGDNWINIIVNPPVNAKLGLSGSKLILRADGMIVRTARLKNTESAYRFESLPVGKKYQITTSYLNGDGIESMESPVLETFVGLASESFTPAKEKFRISDGIEFPIESNVPIQGSLKIYDSQQRLLREIPIDSPAGHSAVRWDGRDDNGNPVFSGIYWAVSETDHFGRKTFKVAGIR